MSDSFGPKFPDCDIDFDYLRSLDELNIAGQPDIAVEIIGYFLQSAPKKISAMERALAINNLAQTRLEAHSLKSTCHNVGARRLAVLCSQIEESTSIITALDRLRSIKEGIHLVEEKLTGYREQRIAS